MKRVRFVCVQRKNKLQNATEKKQTNKQTTTVCKPPADERSWQNLDFARRRQNQELDEEVSAQQLQSSRTTTTTPELKVLFDGVVWSFFSDEEKTVWRDDILDDVPRLSGIFSPSFFVLPLSSSNPPSAAATPRNNSLKTSADSAIKWREQPQEETHLIWQEFHRFWRYSFEADP